LNALVTIQLKSFGFADELGVVTDGMPYAIVVDTGGDGFLPGSYEPFDINSADANGGSFLSAGGVATDDWYTFGNALNSTNQGPPPSSGGYADELSQVRISDDGGPLSPADSGDDFAVIWFPDGSAASIGLPYGFFEDGGLVVPANAATTDFSASIGNSAKTASFQVVPEPSLFAALAGVAALGVVILRRRRQS